MTCPNQAAFCDYHAPRTCNRMHVDNLAQVVDPRERVAGGYSVRIEPGRNGKVHWLKRDGGYTSSRSGRGLWSSKGEARMAAEDWIDCKPRIVSVTYYRRIRNHSVSDKGSK